jgi:hypothetical protein
MRVFMEKEYNWGFCSLAGERRWVGAEYAGKLAFPKAADFRTERSSKSGHPVKFSSSFLVNGA